MKSLLFYGGSCCTKRLKLMGITGPSIVVASLAAWSANSLLGTFSCDVSWNPLLPSLLNWSLKGAVSSDKHSIAFNRDWLSEQMAMLGWSFNTIHFMASLRAAFSSSYEDLTRSELLLSPSGSPVQLGCVLGGLYSHTF